MLGNDPLSEVNNRVMSHSTVSERERERESHTPQFKLYLSFFEESHNISIKVSKFVLFFLLIFAAGH